MPRDSEAYKRVEKMMPKIRILCAAVCLLVLLGGCAKPNNDILPDAKLGPRLMLGLKVKSVEEGYFSIPGQFKGRALLVTQVKPGTYAQEMGIKTGDLIYKINGERVTGMTDSYAVMRKIKGTHFVFVELLREGKRLELTLQLREGW